MKQSIVTAIYIAFIFVLANFMCQKIFELGVFVGKQTRDIELDALGKTLRKTGNVVKFPIDHEIAEQNREAAKSDATDIEAPAS